LGNEGESRGHHFDSSCFAKLLHELFFEGGHLLLFTETGDNVTKTQVILHGDRACAHGPVARPGDADEFVAKEGLRGMLLRKVLLRHDHQIRLAALDPVCTRSQYENLNRDAGRLALDLRQRTAHHNRGDIVRHY
jgi:hypothetical protein